MGNVPKIIQRSSYNLDWLLVKHYEIDLNAIKKIHIVIKHNLEASIVIKVVKVLNVVRCTCRIKTGLVNLLLKVDCPNIFIIKQEVLKLMSVESSVAHER